MNILDRFRLDGKKAFITGGSKGIGRSTAIAFAQAGADVAIVDILGDKAEETAKEIAQEYGVKTIAIKTDVTKPQEVDEMINKVVDTFGTVDVAFNNAGIGVQGKAEEISYEDWKKVIDVNLNGIFLTAQAAARVMIKNGKGGSIINTASMSATIINELFGESAQIASYCTSKAGVVGLTKAVAAEWIKYNIRVNCISPGYINSGMHVGIPQEVLDYWAQKVPAKRFGTLEELQGILLYLASDVSSYTTGADFSIDGGYTIY